MQTTFARSIFLMLATIGSLEPMHAMQDTPISKSRTIQESILISAKQLLPRLGEKDLTIVDVRPLDEYNHAHIPGAVRVDVGEWKKLAVANGGLQDADGWSAKVSRLGITKKGAVVVYGAKTSDTARIWWLLKYVGVDNVSFLDGGWDWWNKDGRAVEKKTPKVAATKFQPEFQASRLAEMAAVKDSLKMKKTKIVDTRSDEEFSNGRIPASVHLEWKQLLKEDGRFKSRGELNKIFKEKGILPDDTAVCY